MVGILVGWAVRFHSHTAVSDQHYTQHTGLKCSSEEGQSFACKKCKIVPYGLLLLRLLLLLIQAKQHFARQHVGSYVALHSLCKMRPISFLILLNGTKSQSAAIKAGGWFE